MGHSYNLVFIKPRGYAYPVERTITRTGPPACGTCISMLKSIHSCNNTAATEQDYKNKSSTLHKSHSNSSVTIELLLGEHG